MRSDFDSYALTAQIDPALTVQQNLNEIQQKQKPLILGRAFQIGELIASLSPDTPPDKDAVQAIFEQLFPSDPSSDSYGTALHYADLVTLCTEIAAIAPDGYTRVFSELFGEPTSSAPQALGRVAYVANSYTEQAFMELTGFIKQRRVAYFHHFDDVCQEVNNGLCEYGILPVESTAEGIMPGLMRLIELYDLRICALCYVPTTQNGRTAFALVRKSLPPMLPTAQHCLDFLFSPADSAETGQLICAAAFCGHTVQHAATYSGQDGELFRFRLSINPDTLYPFLLYLLLFCADITPIGFYIIK